MGQKQVLRKISWIVSVTAILFAPGFMGTAQADFLSCTGLGYDISGNVVSNSGCAILNPPGDDVNDNVTQINADAWFGMSNWSFASKDEGTSGMGQSGTWDTSNVNAGFQALLIFKDGEGTNLVGYLVDAQSSGTWDSPFLCNPPFPCQGQQGTIKDVSHVSTYFKPGDTDGMGGTTGEVPEPGTILLFGTGLAGLGLWRMKKKK